MADRPRRKRPDTFDPKAHPHYQATLEAFERYQDKLADMAKHEKLRAALATDPELRDEAQTQAIEKFTDAKRVAHVLGRMVRLHIAPIRFTEPQPGYSPGQIASFHLRVCERCVTNRVAQWVPVEEQIAEIEKKQAAGRSKTVANPASWASLSRVLSEIEHGPDLLSKRATG